MLAPDLLFVLHNGTLQVHSRDPLRRPREYLFESKTWGYALVTDSADVHKQGGHYDSIDSWERLFDQKDRVHPKQIPDSNSLGAILLEPPSLHIF